MKPGLPLLLALAPLVLAAAPIAAQSYDPQADAARTRAELERYGTQYDAQAANAAAIEADTQARLRRIEAARARPRIGPQAYDPQTASLIADQQAASASSRSADAAMRELDAQLKAMDAFLDAGRPK